MHCLMRSNGDLRASAQLVFAKSHSHVKVKPAHVAPMCPIVKPTNYSKEFDFNFIGKFN